MLQAQFRDYINSDSEYYEIEDYQSFKTPQVQYDENEDISLFDANLIKGMLERKPFGDSGP